MKLALLLILSSCALFAQGTLPPQTQGLQPIENPNDERVKLFKEIELKANAGDTESLERLGDYYFYGQFPTTRSQEKAMEIWAKGAGLGSPNCAAMIAARCFPAYATDSEVVIEKSKWAIITHALRRQQHSLNMAEYPSRPSSVSESSFEEAKSRAKIFLSSVQYTNQTLPASSKKGIGMGSASTGGRNYAGGPTQEESPVLKTKVPALRFESLSLFDEHRRKVCSEYIKASSPIYNKGDAATESEKEAFMAAAKELVRLQNYIGKSRRLGLSSKGNMAMRAINVEKMNEAYAKMASAKIATTLPATRTDLNAASVYINALGQLMQLPVSLGEGY